MSLTDKCNLRCTYCMPAEGLDWLAKPELLTDDEIVRLVRVAVEQLGVDEVRFTGGEPLVRRGIVDIVARTTALQPSPRTSLTTNGLGLAKIAPALAAAGSASRQRVARHGGPGDVHRADPPRSARRT